MDKTEQSIEKVIDRYKDMVYRLAYAQTGNRNDSDDIFQEVFYRYFKKQRGFTSEEHRKAWLIRVTINCAKNYHTSFWNKKTQALKEEVIYFDKREQELTEALNKLKPKYRAVIHLFYYEDHSVEKISEILHIRPSTVRAQLTRARKRLGELLKGDF